MRSKILLLAILGIASSLNYSRAFGQFSKPVCLLKGSVCDQQSGNPVQARIVVERPDSSGYSRTCSSNSASGNYLVVIDCGSHYNVHVRTEGYAPYDTLIQIGNSDKTQKIEANFMLKTSLMAMKESVGDTPYRLWILGGIILLSLVGYIIGKRKNRTA